MSWHRCPDDIQAKKPISNYSSESEETEKLLLTDQAERFLVIRAKKVSACNISSWFHLSVPKETEDIKDVRGTWRRQLLVLGRQSRTLTSYLETDVFEK